MFKCVFCTLSSKVHSSNVICASTSIRQVFMDPKSKGDLPPVRETAGAKTDAAAPKGMDFTSIMQDAPQGNPNDPRVAFNKQLSAIYDVVAREEQDPKQKMSWAHGEHLRQMGNLDLNSGDLLDGRMALELAAQTFHQATDKPANAENMITDTLSDFATSLTKQNKTVHAHLAQAAEIMSSVVERAKMEHRAPAEIVPLLQEKATTEIDFAQLVGHNTPDDTKKYLSTLQTATSELNEALTLSSREENSNDATLSEARLHSELGFAETQINNVDRNNWYNNVWGAGLVGYGKYDTAGEYKQAVALFNQYKPAGEAQKTEVDAEKLTALGRYIKSANKDDKNLADMQKQANDIFRLHPDWDLKL
jgi:hypothetical protein